MQAHGLPGEIQVTRAVRERLEDRYTFRERGVIDVKGVGEMRTWILLGRAEARPEGARPDAQPGQ
jgi:class 3 adenylate cyclase